MEAINDFYVKGLSNAIHFTYNERVLSTLKKQAFTEERIAAAVAAYEAAFKKEDDAYALIRRSNLTKRIGDLDNIRDTNYTAMKAIVAAHLRNPNPAVAEEAEQLNYLMKLYGIKVRDRIDVQTAKTTNWVQHVRAERQQAVTDLGLELFMTNIEQANNELKQLYTQRLDERSERETAAMATARAEVDECYQEVVRLLNAYNVVDEGRYDALVAMLNQYIAEERQKEAQARSARATAKRKAAEAGGDGADGSDGSGDDVASPVPSYDGSDGSNGSDGDSGNGGSSDDGNGGGSGSDDNTGGSGDDDDSIG